MKITRWERVLTSILAWLILFRSPRRRNILHNNLRRLFSEHEAKAIGWRCCKHFAHCLIQMPRLDKILEDVQLRIAQPEHYKAFCKEKKAILLSAHIGLWEFIPRIIVGMKKQAIHFFYREVKQEWANTLMLKWRRADRVFPWNNRTELKHAIKGFKQESGILAMLADQGHGYQSKFYDMPMKFPSGPEKLIKRFKVPAYFCCCVRDGNELVMHMHPLDPENPQLDYIKHLEHLIKLYPEQYLWLTRMWKV